MTSPLQLNSVSKSFTSEEGKVLAVDNVSFSLSPGKVTGLIGPDAAGKTTLMRLIANLLLPDSGQINVLGLDASSQGQSIQSSIGYMPQSFGLYEDLTVQENLDLYANFQSVPLEQRQSRYETLMQMTGLQAFTQRLAGQLSGGMKQKLGLACALVRPPALLLLDEPTVGVDPVSRRELWQIVYNQVQDEGMSVLMSTTYLDEAERCHEVLLMHEGKILGKDKPDEFNKKLTGRTFRLQAKGIRYRSLLAQLAQRPDILDASLGEDSIHLISHADIPFNQAELLAELQTIDQASDIQITPIPAKFEDVFIATLKTQSSSTPSTQKLVASMGSISDNKVIQVNNLEKRFGDFVAVKGIDFSVRQGEIFGLLGANGAGKSTTFRMLCGLLPPTSGNLSVAGHDLRTASAKARKNIGYMAQKFSLYTNLSVIQNLRFFARAYGLDKQRQAERIQWALTTFELTNYQNSNAKELPLGYKQRLSFAAALMHEPDILFLDEPTSGIDPLARQEFWQRTNALAETGITVLVTTHFMEEANYCDRLLIMAEGQVLANGTPHEIRKLATTNEQPHPSIEDAFIHLIEHPTTSAVKDSNSKDITL
ncbi:ATP-binding cassette domain-containing protein [Thiomicrorhabdus sp.]|uniref:ATP-binding cassette domain-containing protein n=1 Tax=Thiomicrorhabdus sp. TaxID=2039724 RepID=UPI002AA870BB|nr:ATP-binding cassette domain-containing protein [Thiomicrorhabdus sp.]